MKSFVETFMEENADTLYCCFCLLPQMEQPNFCDKCTQTFVAFKEFDAETQLEIMREELRNAYN
jgi:hypothetical protein